MTPDQKRKLERAVEPHLKMQVRMAEGRLRAARIEGRAGFYSDQKKREYIRTAIAEVRIARNAYEAAAPNSRRMELTSEERVTLTIAAQILNDDLPYFTETDRHKYSMAILDILDRTFV